MQNNSEEINNLKGQNVDCVVLKRTKFLTSFSFLLLQVLVPGLILFFLTSRDFSFAFTLSLWLMIIFSLSLLIFSVILTFITYKLKLHFIDQFNYVVSFVFFLIALYLSSYWLDYHYFLLRFIIAFGFAVIGLILISMFFLFFDVVIF